ncbi:MAG: IS110 family transposase [Akkermansiaceae bacterium]|nr:IS110 family transposase [Akkermansiaceae bacterium]MCP5548646.1 IS110 family transposase [Akkermansiaceae bacterium]
MNSHCKKELTGPERPNPETTYVGLDISKSRLDSAVADGSPREDANSPEGRAAFVRHVARLANPRVICEATGGYEKAIVGALMEAGIEVCVVQPGRVRHYALAEGLLAKNDRIDARLLARFGEKIQPRCETRPEPSALRLREMLEYRRILTDSIVETRNRMELATGYLRDGLQTRIAALEAAIKQVDSDIDLHISSHAALRSRAKRLRLLCGVGPVLAATLMAYLPELGQVDGKVIAALVGVAPHPNESGGRSRKRKVTGGRDCVRHVLYMAALSAIRYNPILSAFYERLRDQKGKPHKVAIVAVMRKMINVLNHLAADPAFSLA